MKVDDSIYTLPMSMTCLNNDINNITDHCENRNENGYDDDEHFETTGDTNENYEDVLSDYVVSASVYYNDISNELSAELNIDDYFIQVEISTFENNNIASRSWKKFRNHSKWKFVE